MTYAHFTNSKEVIVTTDISQSPADLADFLVGSIIQNNILLYEEMQEKKSQQQRRHATGNANYEAIAPENAYDEEIGLSVDISPLGATLNALDVAKETVSLLEKQAGVLRSRKLRTEYQQSKNVMKR